MTTITIRSDNIRSVTSGTSSVYKKSVICKSHYPTSAEVKCSLYSALENLKSIKDLIISSGSWTGGFRIDTDYDYNGNLLHIEGFGTISGNSLESLLSSTVASGHKVETIIPPKSCFQLTLEETVTPISINFDTGNLQGTIITPMVGEVKHDVIPCE